MNFVKSVFTFLEGKKTYIVGGLMIMLGWLQDDTEMMLQGFGLITLRKGVAKATAK